MPFLAVEKKLDRWGTVIARFPQETSNIIGKVTADAYAVSQIHVPVRKDQRRVRGGFLKNSGTYSSSGQEGEIRYTAYYAGYVHEGTYKMAARPFLRDSVESIVPAMLIAFRGLEGRLV